MREANERFPVVLKELRSIFQACRVLRKLSRDAEKAAILIGKFLPVYLGTGRCQGIGESSQNTGVGHYPEGIVERL